MGRKKGGKNKSQVECSQNTEHPQVVNNITVIEKINTPELTKEQKERQEKLKGVMRNFNKSMGEEVINFGDTVENKQRLSWGYKCLDKLTGGLLCGNFVTLWGSKGSGKSTIAYRTIATNQKLNKICAYIDMERTYDPIWASKFGIDTKSLVYTKVTTAEQALDIIIKLCREKVVDLIVLDSIQALSPKGENVEGKKGEKERSVEDDSMALLARKLSQFFRMATPAVANAKCAVLLIGQARMDLSSFIKLETLSGGRALLHYSRIVLKFRRGQGQDAPLEKIATGKFNDKGKEIFEGKRIGFQLVAKVEKAQAENCREGDEIITTFLFDSGIKE